MTLIVLRARRSGALAVARAVHVTRADRSGDVTVRAVEGVTGRLPAGRLTAVVGPAGSGRATLVHRMAQPDGPGCDGHQSRRAHWSLGPVTTQEVA